MKFFFEKVAYKLSIAVVVVVAIGCGTAIEATGAAAGAEVPSNPCCTEESATGVSGSPLPESSFLDAETIAVLRQRRERFETSDFKSCGDVDAVSREKIRAVRSCQAEAFYRSSVYRDLRALYEVVVASEDIGGVPTESFTPAHGVPRKNRMRVLLNLHGGGFKVGSRISSHLESIPIASVGEIKVISIDYRMMPEFSFPAASEDVEKVYRVLLKTYAPRNIGIFGCSAGGVLTAESVAWLKSKNLQLPGAVGMFCGAASYWSEGDSGYFVGLLGDRQKTRPDDPFFSYFENVDKNDPLAFPVRSAGIMASFPPSLLITSTRDVALSSVVYTHSVLVQQRVPAELHVWEGMGHAFFFDPRLAQSREVYRITVEFFDRYLGRN